MFQKSRRSFIKDILSLLAWSSFWPRLARAQMIPFAYWRKVPQTNLWVWGVNTYGQLGLGNRTSYSSPVQLAGSWLQVNSAWTINPAAFSMGIRTNGTLWAWGDNTYGELGQGTSGATHDFSSPVQIQGSWVQAACGGQGWANMYGLAIQTNGSLWAWGDNGQGTLAQGNTTSSSSPVQVMPGTSWNAICGGFGNWLGIQTNGTLWACGSQGAGELGVGTATAPYSSPVQVPGSWTQALIMCDTSPGGYSGGIQSNGTLWMWGGNGNGDLGLGNLTEYSSPVQLGSNSWIQLSMSSGSAWGGHVLAIRSDRTLWAWGRNVAGQLAQGNTTDYSSPVQIPGSWRQVFAVQTTGNSASFGLRNDGTLWAWGDNTSGIFGLGNSTGMYSSPVQVGTGGWAFIGGGQNCIMALN